MKFVPMPMFPCKDEELAAWREIVGTPKNIAAYASQRVLAGVIPAEGPTKPWRDNAAAIWGTAESYQYATVLPGSVFEFKLRSRQSDAGTATVDVQGITNLEGLFSAEVIAFYNRRILQSGGAEFSRIPAVSRFKLVRNEAARMSIMNPPSPVHFDLPIEQPLRCALRFGSGGIVEAFDPNEYDREFPITSSAMPDQELIDAVESIIDSRMPVANKARAIRLVAAK